MDITFGRGDLTALAVRDADPFVLAQAVGALTGSDIAALDRRESEALVIACERITAAVQARQSLAADTLAGVVDADLERERTEIWGAECPGGPSVHGVVASTLSPALHCATRTAARRLVADRWLVCQFEATFSAVWSGDLERHRADVVVEAGLSVPPGLREEFEALVLESSLDRTTGDYAVMSEHVRDLSRAQLARRAQSIARELDDASAEVTGQRGHDARTVRICPDRGHPGMARWVALIPAETSQRMAAAVEALAGDYARAQPGLSIDAARADALGDLVLARAEVRTTVELLVPAASTVGSQHPAGLSPSAAPGRTPARWFVPGGVEDVRHGCLAPEVVARLLASPDVTLRLARLDADGSIVQDTTCYRPSASTRRRVRSRDGSCRFPGCQTPARLTDTDHVIPHPWGPTDHTNLICLCRTHHGFKHHGGWTPILQSDGTVTWTTPDGRQWTTHPSPSGLGRHLHAVGADPDLIFDLRRGAMPGLAPGLTMSDLIAAEALLPEHDPPDTGLVPSPPDDWPRHLAVA